MANPIDIIITKEALAAIDLAIKKVDSLDKELAQTAQNFIDNSRKMASAASNLTPSSVSGKGTDTAKVSADLDKLKTKYVQLNDTIVKKAEQARLAELRLQQQREKAFDTFNKNAQKEDAALKKSETAYQRIQNSVNILTKTYQELAIRKELGSTLTTKEEKQLESVTKRINTYQDALKKVDTQIGKNGRHVGDYARQYNGLGNAVNQITREAPAAAVSMNTFFLAISNNLPILFDELGRIREQNKLLIAEGKEANSTIKQLGSAIFSWGTALSIGVTLLTLFGGKLVESIFNLGNMEKALKRVEAQQELYNNQLKDANRNIEHNLILEKNRRKLLGQTEADLIGLDKEAALQKLKNYETTRDANKKLLDQEIKRISDKKGLGIVEFTEEINIKEKLVSEKLRLEKKLGKDLVKNTYLARTEQEKMDVDLLAKTNNKLYVLETLSQDEIYQKRKEGYIKSHNEAVLYGQQVSELFSQLKLQQKDDEDDYLSDLAEMSRKEIELLIEKNNKILENEDLYYSDRFKALDEDLRLKNRLIQIDRDEEIRLAKDNYAKKKTAELNYQIENLKLIREYSKQRDELASQDLDQILKRLDILDEKKVFKMLTDSTKEAQKELEKYGDRLEKTRLSFIKMQAATNSWIKSFTTDIFQGSGLTNIFTYFDNSFKSLVEGTLPGSLERFQVYFNSIAESAQQTFNFLSQLTEKNFEGEKNRLQNQYDIAIKYAGDNKEAQEKLETDLEERKKDIANREAKAKKKQALFNIAIDTAQAVVSALPNYVLAAVVAAIGVAQAVIVNSQEIPQYWMGGTHDGGLMMVNDGKGNNYKETIVTPDGKIIKPQGRNVIMDAPKGTEIYTHEMWNDKLSEMLQGKGIDMAPSISYSGLSKTDMYDVLSDTLGMQTQHHSNFDAEGATSYILKRGNKTTDLSKRGNSTKKRFT